MDSLIIVSVALYSLSQQFSRAGRSCSSDIIPIACIFITSNGSYYSCFSDLSALGPLSLALSYLRLHTKNDSKLLPLYFQTHKVSRNYLSAFPQKPGTGQGST